MTAAQWLEKQYLLTNGKLVCQDFEYAEKLEKQQIINAFEAGEDNIDQDGCHIDDYGKVNYYNETYGSKGSETKQ